MNSTKINHFLFQTPIEILEYNNNKKRYGTDDKDLIILDRLKEISNLKWLEEGILFENNDWASTDKNDINKSIDRFDLKIFKKYFVENYENIVLSLLTEIKNVALAGGAVLNPIYYNIGKCPKDYDLYIYGLETELEIQNKVQEIQDYISENKDYKLEEISYKKGVVSFIIYKNGNYYNDKIEIQVMTFRYNNKSEIIHSFDMGPSCFLFDGINTYCTVLGAYSLIYNIIIADPKAITQSYAYRIRKYMRKGFELFMPLLDNKKFLTSISLNKKIDMYGFTFIINDASDNFLSLYERNHNQIKIKVMILCKYLNDYSFTFKPGKKITLEKLKNYLTNIQEIGFSLYHKNKSIEYITSTPISEICKECNIIKNYIMTVIDGIRHTSIENVMELNIDKEILISMITEKDKNVLKEILYDYLIKFVPNEPINIFIENSYSNENRILNSWYPIDISQEEWYGKYLAPNSKLIITDLTLTN